MQMFVLHTAFVAVGEKYRKIFTHSSKPLRTLDRSLVPPSAKSLSNISTNPSEVITKFSDP